MIEYSVTGLLAPFVQDEEALLNAMGEQGWELIQVTTERGMSENYVYYYFKRYNG